MPRVVLAFSPTGMIDPDSAYKLVWDWIVISFVLYSTIALPIDIAFFDLKCEVLQVSVPARLRRYHR